MSDSMPPVIAFLFPGQGSQRVGMGSDLAAQAPELFGRYMAAAEECSGYPIRALSLEGPLESLTRTQVAQPAIFALSAAVLEDTRELGVQPAFVAGHSLGEFTAAVASGALAFADGMELVCERGRLMAEIQAEHPGAMGAVIGMEAARVADLCRDASSVALVVLANLNTRSQVVVSGEVAGVERVLQLARDAGAEEAVRLTVGAAFHSPLMKPVQVRLAAEIAKRTWRDPLVPFVANVSGEVLTDGAAIRAALVAQTTSPVLWVRCLETMLRNGVRHFLEIGPGRVLTGLTRQVDPDVDAAAADAPQRLRAFVRRLAS